ncbi:MAG TPA: ribosome biogenesis GTP-binding protein YihA/YsxC [bacterium]|nr:ribosome biogenesis GTP-binding protein YihA/YsxC [bacterium]
MSIKVVKAEFIKSATDPKEYPPVELPEIALAGRSNVGKSSAINALVQRHGLAVTSSTPGRTRLVNFFEVRVKPSGAQKERGFRLVDLPGYGFAQASKGEREEWRPRVEKYLAQRPTLRAVVHLMDARHEPSDLDIALTDWLHSLGREEIPVFTKADKLTRNEQLTRKTRLEAALGMEKGEGILFSAAEGLGHDELWRRILDAIA